jgi:protein phosphatase
VGVAFDTDEAYVAHVGDSRVYRFRDGQLSLLTEDHSLLNDYKKMAQLTEEEERNFPHKNIIVRALGMKDRVLVDLLSDGTEPGDLYLLCSDGLTGEVSEPEIREILSRCGDNLERACQELIEAACEHGGKDNITAVIIQVVR